MLPSSRVAVLFLLWCALFNLAFGSQPECTEPQIISSSVDLTELDASRSIAVAVNTQASSSYALTLDDQPFGTTIESFPARAVLEIAIKYGKYPNVACNFNNASIANEFQRGESNSSLWGSVAKNLNDVISSNGVNCQGMGYLTHMARLAAGRTYFDTNRKILTMSDMSPFWQLAYFGGLNLRTYIRAAFQEAATELVQLFQNQFIPACKGVSFLSAAEKLSCENTYKSYISRLGTTLCEYTAPTRVGNTYAVRDKMPAPSTNLAFNNFALGEYDRFCITYWSVLDFMTLKARLNSSPIYINNNMFKLLSSAEPLIGYIVSGYTLSETLPYQARISAIVAPKLDADVKAMINQPTNDYIANPINYYTPGQPCHLCQIDCYTPVNGVQLCTNCQYRYFNYGCSSLAPCWSVATASVSHRDQAIQLCTVRCGCTCTTPTPSPTSTSLFF